MLAKTVVVKTPKTENSACTDVLPTLALEALREHRLRHAKRRHDMLGLPIAGQDDFVFDRHATGEGWGPNELSRMRTRLARRKKLPHLRKVILAIVLMDLAWLASVGNDGGVAARLEQPTDPARMRSGLERNLRQRQPFEVLAKTSLRGAHPFLSTAHAIIIQNANVAETIADVDPDREGVVLNLAGWGFRAMLGHKVGLPSLHLECVADASFRSPPWGPAFSSHLYSDQGPPIGEVAAEP